MKRIALFALLLAAGAAYAQPNLELEITDTYDPVAPGGLVRFEIAYRNSGGATATGVAISTTYDAGYFYNEAHPAPDPNLRDRWTIGDLPPGSSGTIVVAASARNDLADGYTMQTTARLTHDQGPELSASQPTTLNIATLSISATAEYNPVAPNGSARYTISYRNEDDNPAHMIVLYAALDPRLHIRSSSLTPDDDQTSRWTLPRIDPGSSGNIVIDMDVDPSATPGDDLTSSFSITAGQTSWNTTLNSNVATPSPSINVTSEGNRTQPGSTITFLISFANESGTTLFNAEIDASLDAGLSATSIIPSPNADNSWNLGTLEPGARGTITVVATVDANTPYGSRLGSQATLRGTLGNSTSSPLVEVTDSSNAALIASCGLTIASTYKSSPLPGDQVAGTTQVCDPCADHTDVLIETGFASGLQITKFAPTSLVEQDGPSLFQFMHTLSRGSVVAISHLTAVDPSMPPGTSLEHTTTVRDSSGLETSNTGTVEVRNGERAPLVRLGSARRSKIGKSLTIKARYSDVSPDMTLRITLPPDVILDSVQPYPTSTEGSDLVFTNLPDDRGKIKIRARVAEWTNCLVQAEATLTGADQSTLSTSKSATAVNLAD